MTVRVAFVGAGGRASAHLDALADLDAEVVAVCDVDRQTAADAAPPEAAVYTDAERMFEAESFDALFLVVPPFAHDGQELLAADHGVDLFVEKPLCLSAERAAETSVALSEAGCLAAAGYQLRYADAAERAAELLADRTVGLVEGYYKSGVPGAPWWRERAKSGGQVVEQATHVYDLLRRFGGEVEEVSAYGGHRLVEEIDFEDAVTATTRHEDGVVGTVTSTSAAEEFHSGVEIIGEGVQIRLRGNTLSGTVDGEQVSYEGDNDPTRTQAAAFVEAVERGDPAPIRSTYADAARTLALTLAVEESLATGAPAAPADLE